MQENGPRIIILQRGTLECFRLLYGRAYYLAMHALERMGGGTIIFPSSEPAPIDSHDQFAFCLFPLSSRFSLFFRLFALSPFPLFPSPFPLFPLFPFSPFSSHLVILPLSLLPLFSKCTQLHSKVCCYRFIFPRPGRMECKQILFAGE